MPPSKGGMLVGTETMMIVSPGLEAPCARARLLKGEVEPPSTLDGAPDWTYHVHEPGGVEDSSMKGHGPPAFARETKPTANPTATQKATNLDVFKPLRLWFMDLLLFRDLI